MLKLIIGGSASGKSDAAEREAVDYAKCSKSELIYIATMQPFDSECEQRILKHRQMRAGKGFKTVECFTDLNTVKTPQNSVVLLECMSNLLANEMYSKPSFSEQNIAEKILDGVKNLIFDAKSVIIVTNEVFLSGDYDVQTQQYISLLGEINRQIAALADIVTEVVFSIEITHKGSNERLQR